MRKQTNQRTSHAVKTMLQKADNKAMNNVGQEERNK